MKIFKLDTPFELYESLAELPEIDQKLMLDAQSAAKDAYAPYSHFHVGAAVLLENGDIIKGNNQENAAYPSGLCAERVALFSAGAQHPNVKIQTIAITAYPEATFSYTVSVSPCGDCRQVMSEYENRYEHNIRLIMETDGGKYIVTQTVRSLLPFVFTAESLR